MLIDGLVPFSNYTVQVNASNSRGSLTSEPAEIALPPGGKSMKNGNYSILYESRELSFHSTSYLLLKFISLGLGDPVAFLVVLFGGDTFINILLLFY